jgi:multidrug efflux pump subunit AcrB
LLLFESVVTPFVLLFTIPLAAIGSLLALLLSSNSLMNANTLTGFLILLGVVVNNGIILIDYANILRKRGYRRNRALMTAGMSRIRPILITSITTIAAMLPLAMGDTEYAGAIGAPCYYSDWWTSFLCLIDVDFDSYCLHGIGKCALVVSFFVS